MVDEDGPPDSAAEPAAGSAAFTSLLARAQEGDRQATDELLPLVYEELRQLADRFLAAEKRGATLQPTALVHEAYLRLVGSDQAGWENRAHFFGAAARAMQRILVEHARARGRDKRVGGRQRQPLSVVDLAVEPDLEQVLAVQSAVERLEAVDPRLAEIVRLRFYAGLGVEETAKALGLSERTVRRDWTMARAWLIRELG